MSRHNYIVRVSMSQEELDNFMKILPMVGMAMSPSGSNIIARVLGFQSTEHLTDEGFPTNPFLKKAYSILSFLYVSRQDGVAFNDFWDRLLFTDKAVERKVKRIFNIPEDEDAVTTNTLEMAYKIPCTKEEWDDADSLST